MPDLVDRVGVVVDLAADFRLRDPAAYPTWYGEAHQAPELLGVVRLRAAGAPPRPSWSAPRLIAAPGCYPTAALLALVPLLEAGAIARPGDDGAPALVVDAASGVSGAGRAPKESLHFATVDEDFVAYGLLDHRHTAEMEQGLGTHGPVHPPPGPHGPGDPGHLLRPTGRPAGPSPPRTPWRSCTTGTTTSPSSSSTDAPPSTKAASGSNTAHLSVRVDPRTGWVVVLSAIDNLVKGAAGQAVQCANLALGLPEGAGLPMVGVYP